MPLFSGRCYSNVRLVGKTAVITGCNTGIGKETVLDFYKRGARIVMACRDTTKAEEAAKDIQQQCLQMEGVGSIVITKLDLGSLASVKECANHLMETETKIDLLINNAGVMMCPEGKTEDGFETQFGTNHLGHFLFTMLLLPKIIKSTPARIVNVSSRAHLRGVIEFEDPNFEKRPYSAMAAYNQSKLANVMFSNELVRKIKSNNIDGVNVYSLHPGVVKTELGRHIDNVYFRGLSLILRVFFSVFMKTPESGAQTTIYCGVDDKCANETGQYYCDCAISSQNPIATDESMCAKLWDMSWKMVGLGDFNPFASTK